MAGIQPTSQWTGMRGRAGGWYLNSPLRRLSELLLLGDCRTAFLNEVSGILKGNEVVLDVGAGSGYFALPMATRLAAGKVICLDLSEEMLRRLEGLAKRKGLGDRIQTLQGEASSLRLGGEQVDLAVCNGVFHELSDPASVLRAMAGVLKPGGRVIVTDFRDTALGKLIGAAHDEASHGPLSIDELEALFAEAGLRDAKVYPVRHWVVGVARSCSSR